MEAILSPSIMYYAEENDFTSRKPLSDPDSTGVFESLRNFSNASQYI